MAIANEYRGTLKRVALDPSSGNSMPPDFEGTCTLNGDAYWISGWVNKTRGKPFIDLVFQLAERGNAPHRFKPDDLRLKSIQREKPTQRDLDWSHYMHATREHRESGTCPRCNRVHQHLDNEFGAEPPY